MPHKFKVGQLVDYYPPRGIYAPRGPYLIAAQLPKRDGEFEYHIRHPNEVHDRIVTESQLSIAQVTASSAEITEYMGYQLEARPLGKGWRVLIYPPRPRGGGANNTDNRDGYKCPLVFHAIPHPAVRSDVHALVYFRDEVWRNLVVLPVESHRDATYLDRLSSWGARQ